LSGCSEPAELSSLLSTVGLAKVDHPFISKRAANITTFYKVQKYFRDFWAKKWKKLRDGLFIG
jgi:hypothetical protein